MISIIIPIYNSELYLSECIESVLKQSYNNFELLLIDDGSTDHSLEICKHYELLDKRVKVFHIPNSGVSHARNVGLAKALGEWVTFLDSDDWLSEDYLYALQEELNVNVLNIVQANKYENGRIVPWPIRYETGVYDWSKVSKSLDNILVYGTPWGKMFNRNIIFENGINFDENISNHEDHLFYFTYLLYVDQIRVCTYGSYYYRIFDATTLSRKIPQYFLLLYAYEKLNAVFLTLLHKHALDQSNFPYMRHFLLYIKVKALRSVWVNNDNVTERKEVLSKISRKEIFWNYKCRSLKSFCMKFLLLMPEPIRSLVLFLVRKYLRS